MQVLIIWNRLLGLQTFIVRQRYGKCAKTQSLRGGKKLSDKQWMDVKYEELVRRPKDVLQKICDFIDEKYSPIMLDFYNSDIARARGATRDHKPLGSPVSDKYIGIYKYLLSQRDQEIFTGVAHDELVEYGYESNIKALILDEGMKNIYKEIDGRIRAATLMT